MRFRNKTLLSLLICNAFATSLPATARAADAEIVSIIGRGDERESSADDWSPASVRQKLKSGAFVRTHKASQMAILLQDQTQLRINQDSMVQIKEVSARGETTKLELTQGRVWAQAKRKIAATPLSMPAVTVETPNAIAAIRGTDWEMVVDKEGVSTLTVLSGEVEFYNDFGRVSVRPNEQARVEPGKAPTKLLLTNARERIQWVTAYRPQPRQWLHSVPSDLQPIVDAITGERYADALVELEGRSRQSADVNVSLLLADLYLSLGRMSEAIGLLERQQSEPRAAALLARAYLIDDRADDAGRILQAAQAAHPDDAEILLAQGDLARFNGDASGAKKAYRQALAIEPNNPDAWFGVGRVDSELEAVKDGRKSLGKAIAINPTGPGYQGELATLRSFANEFAAAENGFNEALGQQPDDYVSLTGLGILQLKRGKPDAALESFLKSGVIEPRYARGALYTGVAYYQLGNYKRAMEMFKRAAELDAKDPMPYMMMSLAATDKLDFGAAIAAARRASELMPYLKSLNQLLNDQKGNANIGTSLAKFGMEDWSQAYAHDSYTPYWAGSHLFLADRYDGDFNKNSELFLGFLSEPTVFGASNRFNTIVQSPGHYANVRAGVMNEDFKGHGMTLSANGYSAARVPFSYFASAEPVHLQPAFKNMAGNGNTYTVGLGIQPAYELGSFLFANDISVHARNVTTGSAPVDITLNDGNRRVDFGFNYRFSPVSQLWVKAGNGRDDARAKGSSLAPANANALNGALDAMMGWGPLCAGAMPGGCYSSNADITSLSAIADQNDLQLRHTFDVGDAWQISWGGERGRQQKPFDIRMSSLPVPSLSFLPAGTMEISGNDDVRTTEFYLFNNFKVRSDLRFQVDLSHTQLNKRQLQQMSVFAVPLSPTRDDRDVREWNPRLGVVWNPVPGQTLRIAAQDWRRPAAVNTLAPLDTAGIPVDDRLVALGGRMKRVRAQYEWEMSADTFVQGFVDSKRVANLSSAADTIVSDFGLVDLQRLRNSSQLVPVAQDLWEDIPQFGMADVNSVGVSANRLLSDILSGSVRYYNNHSRNTGAGLQGKQVPLLARHVFSLGANWQPFSRWQLGVTSTYRGSRYLDEANTQLLSAGWNFGLRASWESVDKRWLFEAVANNLHANKKAAATHSSILGAQLLYRF